ncbi:carbohydrate ABC transporter permease [Cohnella nanjingensis]|uniref:Carbohydrate ABC transporter permease n=1 Tax=Cohnella nanjingensis TaxID=1387779 RepID=A0A7X0RWA5_9BACL|nr:carbohydrate ABC transporter permease [Cohnella nanjingensis]MBB6674864.1 carbohydrate ABC transporter permease [Cohnella nanjingensis]
MKRYGARLLTDGALLVVAAFMFAPFLWIISTSLRLPQNSFDLPPAILPTTFNFDNYGEVFKRVPLLAFMLNSLKVAGLIVIGHVFISSMAAYAFARLSFPGKNAIFLIFLSGLMIPGQVTIIPQFILLSKLDLVDTHAALILPALINPFGIFLIRQMMMTISPSYEEAAFIDGAGRVRGYLNVILPMSVPVIAMTSVMTFIAHWNDFFRPLIFLNTAEKMTLPIGMTVLNGQFGAGNLSAILAGVTITLIVPMLFYIFGQKYLIEGIAGGGLKV